MAEVKKTVKKAKTKTIEFLGTGRRKRSVARVRLIANGKGNFTINGVSIDEYFELDILKLIALQSLELVGAEKQFDVIVNVSGGGLTGQAGAILHGISRALVLADEQYKPEIKKAGFLTRDARKKERKKYGLKKARKAPQFSKR